MKRKLRSSTVSWFILFIMLTFVVALLTQAQPVANPDETGPCPVSSQSLTVNDMELAVYYPDGSCGAYVAAPYPAIAFAHGFSMFGLSDGAGENQGNGQHLASWGYVVAIPTLPDDAEERTGLLLDVVTYLETQAGDANTFLYQKVDVDRLAVAGYSLGGSTALSAAARDGRIKAVVALDPVYHAGNFSGEGEIVWDAATEAPQITVPAGILGAPADSCNAQADYTEIYPLIGAEHKAYYHLVDASHCVFADPGSSFCGFTCGGTVDAAMTHLSQKYMTAWLNYYLQQKTEFYAYLYGEQLQIDMNAGTIEHGANTPPRGLTAVALPEAAALRWQLTDYPIIAGYHLYRRLPAGAFPSSPQITVGRETSFMDAGLTAGQPYEYAIRSYDSAGNLHQLSGVVTAVPLECAGKQYLPFVCQQ